MYMQFYVYIGVYSSDEPLYIDFHYSEHII